MRNLFMTRLISLVIPAVYASMLSCVPRGDKIALNPALLFTVESRYLNDVSAAAVKGSIEYEDFERRQTADFKAVFNGGDSIFFLTEGPFYADLFHLIITGDSAFVKNRDSDFWEAMESVEPFDLSEYDLEELAPIDLGPLILPQFFLRPSGESGRELRLISIYGNREFQATPSSDNTTFSLRIKGAAVRAAYSKGRRFQGGVFPSEIEISDKNNTWSMRIEITSIKLNPIIKPEIWRISQ